MHTRVPFTWRLIHQLQQSVALYTHWDGCVYGSFLPEESVELANHYGTCPQGYRVQRKSGDSGALLCTHGGAATPVESVELTKCWGTHTHGCSMHNQWALLWVCRAATSKEGAELAKCSYVCIQGCITQRKGGVN